MEDLVEKVVEIKTLTSKQIKKLAKPEFAANPDKFYPVDTLRKWGFHRTQCPKCQEHFWRHSEKKEVCGDSRCEGRYHFIGQKLGKGKKGKVSYSQAWDGFKRSFESAKIPHTAIKRYPVVARWRADVDYVAAGIYCFQPYCVTGELEPPANPLICPQFCMRFNDLDSVGLSGRHYSGFIMLGIQVFNTPDKWVYFKEECVDFNLRWLTQELEIDIDEITLIEDVWAGGGNLGPSIEYFIGGLELGNMVFMQYKTFPDGSRKELEVKVIDVGIGLERVPWLLNGSPTSYMEVFPTALKFMSEKIGLGFTNEYWEKYGPYSCLLNMDEVEDEHATWKKIADHCGVDSETLMKAITPVRDMYVICDHTRTVLVAIEDGSLPSNTGGAANLRNILRLALSKLVKNTSDGVTWWKKIGELEGFLNLFDCHKKDLSELYGQFKEYKSFKSIIEIEYQRWATRDLESKKKLTELMKKRNGNLTIDDWLYCVSILGMDAERIKEETKLPIPGTLYLKLAEKQETTARAPLRQLYDTATLPSTEELFYNGESSLFEFKAKVITTFNNVESKESRRNIVVLDSTCFYPTSGGQEHDSGSLNIKGTVYQITDVQKVGKAILHYVDQELPADLKPGEGVEGKVDSQRRYVLRNHHTATHIMYAASRKVLGPHVWQHGAKKTTKSAHLDITHFKALTPEEELAIENLANKIVFSGTQISKYNLPKEEAEKKYGFSLYQGGVVPGNTLRVVDIAGVDQEACCGTHCENTAQVGVIKLLKSSRISDGIVRLSYVAGDLALEFFNSETRILNDLCEDWGVTQSDIIPTAKRFFEGYKKFGTKVKKQSMQIVDLQVNYFLMDQKRTKLLIQSIDEPTATLYLSSLPSYAQKLKDSGKSVIAIGTNWIYGIGNINDLDKDSISKAIEESKKKKGSQEKEMPFSVKDSVSFKDNKKRVTVDGIAEIMGSIGSMNIVVEYLKKKGFEEEQLLLK